MKAIINFGARKDIQNLYKIHFGDNKKVNIPVRIDFRMMIDSYRIIGK